MNDEDYYRYDDYFLDDGYYRDDYDYLGSQEMTRRCVQVIDNLLEAHKLHGPEGSLL